MSISIEQAKDELTQLLAKNKLCIFAGSGISVPAPSNLPTWDQFVDKYIEICGEVNKVVDSTMKFGDILADAPSYKTKSAVNTLTVLKDKIRLCKKHGMSTSIYDDMMNELFSGREPNDYHETIVNTDYKYILTTNYDTLLDKAAMRQKHYDLVRRIYSYKDLQKISEAVYTGEPAIIHVHGIATEVVLEDFVLTADDYKKIRDKNKGLRTLLNILFMNYSMLYSETVLGAALIRSKSVICWMIRSMASFLALFVEVKYFRRMVWNSLTACTHTAFSSAENGMGS